jgi:hypothetical protein
MSRRPLIIDVEPWSANGMGRTGDKYPAWIEWLFQSGVGSGNFDPPYALSRQRNDRRQVTSMVESETDGARQLREASLTELRGDDPGRVERSLFYLMMVGQPADVPSVERLLGHPKETIKKAARTCLFELKRQR